MKFNLNPPCVILYRDTLGRNKAGETIYGLTRGPVVWIVKGTNKGVLAHEFEHVKQWWMHGLFVHSLLLRVPRYRAWCEAKAMKVQLEAKNV